MAAYVLALGILGVLPSKQVYAGLSRSTVVLFRRYVRYRRRYVKKGLAEAIGIAVVKKAGTNQVPLMAQSYSLPLPFLSVSSIPGDGTLPHAGWHRYLPGGEYFSIEELMPLAIARAANVGGTITMIGLLPNVKHRRSDRSRSADFWIFFEFAYIGNSAVYHHCSTHCSSAVILCLISRPVKWMKRSGKKRQLKKQVLPAAVLRRAKAEGTGFQTSSFWA